MRKVLGFAMIFLFGLTVSACGSSDEETTTTVATTTEYVAPTFSRLKVSASTKKVTNVENQEVYLRGVNLGGWLVQEAWMTNTNSPDQKTTLATFTTRFGEDKCQELIDTWEDNWITTTDLDNIQDMGLNVVRVPFTYMNFLNSDETWKTDWYKRLDWIIEECGNRNIYVILDLHGAPGSQNGNDHSGNSDGNPKLYASTPEGEHYRELTVEIWEQLATRYKDNDVVCAYDLLNEPTNGGLSNAIQWNFYDVLYEAVKAIDYTHIMMMEAVWDPANMPNPEAYGWENVMYQYHQYLWDNDNNGTEQAKAMLNKVKNCTNNSYGLPTFMGEFSLFSDRMAWRKGISYMNQYKMHWTSWSYKVTGSGSNTWGIYNNSAPSVNIYDDDFETIKAKWTNVGEAVYNKQFYGMYAIFKDYATGKTNY